MPLILQYVLIALAVMLALAFVWRTRFPRAWRATRIAIAIAMLREGNAAWMQRVGRRIAPASVLAAGGCGGCNGCG